MGFDRWLAEAVAQPDERAGSLVQSCWSRRVHVACLAVILGVLLTGCSEQSATDATHNSRNPVTSPATTRAGEPVVTAATMPLSAGLQSRYDASCRACHGNSAFPAPQAHDTAAWQSRLQKGMPLLIEHTVQGFNAMPPNGNCASCSPADLESLIGYMAGPKPLS